MIDFSDLKIDVVEESSAKGVYKMGPLPRGYGHTLANSLRRVLLSSLQGAAVTSLKIAGVDHEYSTLKGVKETVVEIEMNIKSIRFSCESDDPQVIRVSSKGAGDITAGDFQLTESVQILSPDVKLLTITDKDTAVDIEMVVERGVGYVVANEDLRSEVGRLPLDADYSPIERVMFSVDETRKGEKMNLDMVTLTVFTDGSVTPKDALGFASDRLRDVFERLMILVGVAAVSSDSEVSDEKEVRVSGDFDDVPVEELPISKRARASLIEAGVKNLGEVAKKTAKELLDIPGFGGKALSEVKELLESYSISLS